MLQNLDLKKHGVWIAAAVLLVLYVIVKGRQAAATVPPAAAAPLSTDPQIDPTSGQDYSGEIQSIHDDIAVLAGTIGEYLSAPYSPGSGTTMIGCPLGSIASAPSGACQPCASVPGAVLDSSGRCALAPSAPDGPPTSTGPANCPSGSAWDGTQCVPCPSGYTCAGGSAPPVQSNPNPASPNCAPGSAWDGAECVRCPSNYSCPGGSAPPIMTGAA